MLLRAHLSSNIWGHVVLYAAALLRLRPTLLNVQTPYELLSGRPPNISHIRVFRCQVWVPLRDPLTRILYKAQFANCKFLETTFRALPTTSIQPPLNFGARDTLTMNPDPPTLLPNTKVTKLLNMKSLAENTPDGFSTEPRIIRNHISGTGLNLPRKRSNPTPSSTKPINQPKFIIQPSPLTRYPNLILLT